MAIRRFTNLLKCKITSFNSKHLLFYKTLLLKHIKYMCFNNVKLINKAMQMQIMESDVSYHKPVIYITKKKNRS